MSDDTLFGVDIQPREDDPMPQAWRRDRSIRRALLNLDDKNEAMFHILPGQKVHGVRTNVFHAARVLGMSIRTCSVRKNGKTYLKVRKK